MCGHLWGLRTDPPPRGWAWVHRGTPWNPSPRPRHPVDRVKANTCLVCCGEDVHACSVASIVSDSLGPHGQVPLSVELSGPQYYSGLPFPRDQTQISCLGMGVPVLPSVSSGPHSAALRLRVPLEGAEVSQPAEAWPCLFLVCSHFLPPLAEKPSLVAQTDGKVTTCNVGDMGLIPGLERSSREGMVTHSSG